MGWHVSLPSHFITSETAPSTHSRNNRYDVEEDSPESILTGTCIFQFMPHAQKQLTHCPLLITNAF